MVSHRNFLVSFRRRRISLLKVWLIRALSFKNQARKNIILQVSAVTELIFESLLSARWINAQTAALLDPTKVKRSSNSIRTVVLRLQTEAVNSVNVRR